MAEDEVSSDDTANLSEEEETSPLFDLNDFTIAEIAIEIIAIAMTATTAQSDRKILRFIIACCLLVLFFKTISPNQLNSCFL